MAGLSTRSLNDAEIDYKAAFNAFDKDGDGSITHDDIKSILASLNEDITAAEIDEIVKEADVDGSNKINYEEYVKLMVSYIFIFLILLF
jgi:Ca2+-binding EF-hand superfamily protein